MMKKFFSYDPDTGMARHDTAEEAKVSAQSAIDMYRDVAGDPDTGWPEEVEGVCWGEIRQQAKERDTTEETGMGFETCDYELTEIDESDQACVIGVVEETADLRRQLAEAQARLAELDGRRDAVREAVAEALGEAMDCTRVWSAWGHGTMGPNDFTLVIEDAGRIDEIADAAIAAMRVDPAPSPADQKDAAHGNPFEFILTKSQKEYLESNGYELKYLPIYADQPDPTYITKWVWEVRDEHGASVAEAHEWLYSAIDAAMLAASPGVERAIASAVKKTANEVGKRQFVESVCANATPPETADDHAVFDETGLRCGWPESLVEDQPPSGTLTAPDVAKQAAAAVFRDRHDHFRQSVKSQEWHPVMQRDEPTPSDSPAHRAAKVLMEALEKLARLGNGDRYGNSEGNVIAQTALAAANQIMEGGE